MIILQLITSLLCLFPLSFFAYMLSERMLATHQSRVGMGQSGKAFFLQGLINTRDLLRRKNELSSFFLFAAQISFVSLIPFFENEVKEREFSGGFIICILLSLFALVVRQWPTSRKVLSKILFDEKTVQNALGATIALISVFSVFSMAQSWSLSEVVAQQRGVFFHWGIFWSPVQLVFLALFQIAGMLMFDEHPFVTPLHAEGLENNISKSPWLSSARFYIWSLVATSLFLGGDSFLGESGTVLCFFALQVKTLFLYSTCRLLAQYFPSHAQDELLKLSLLFLLPLSLVCFVFSLLMNGAILASRGI